MVTLQLQQIELFPGQKIVLKNISWGQFEAILEALGEHQGSRLTYSQKTFYRDHSPIRSASENFGENYRFKSLSAMVRETPA